MNILKCNFTLFHTATLAYFLKEDDWAKGKSPSDTEGLFSAPPIRGVGLGSDSRCNFSFFFPSFFEKKPAGSEMVLVSWTADI